jgi:hypothetical protein
MKRYGRDMGEIWERYGDSLLNSELSKLSPELKTLMLDKLLLE